MSARRIPQALFLCALVVVTSCAWAFPEEIETYEEWCNRLDDLKRELNLLKNGWYENRPMLAGLAATIALGVSLTSLPCSHWLWDVPFAVTLLVMAAPGVVGIIVSSSRWLNVTNPVVDSFSETRIHSLVKEYVELILAGERVNWSYPCDE